MALFEMPHRKLWTQAERHAAGSRQIVLIHREYCLGETQRLGTSAIDGKEGHGHADTGRQGRSERQTPGGSEFSIDRGIPWCRDLRKAFLSK